MDFITDQDKTFENTDYAGKRVGGREFQDCLFRKCDFSDSDFSGCRFIDCLFESCNLSMMKCRGTTFNDVSFKQSKILGMNFSECGDFSFVVGFDNCVLDYSSFMGRKMTKTKFVKCSLKEVNFTQTLLSGSVFGESDLSGAVFNETDLVSADFSTALHFSIDPSLNNIKKAMFSMEGLPGLLTRYQIKIV
ncbi:MAG: pentapeptide repeat-containing protein [Puia sp.]|nr:pentapeptide repeat-containing protein [Puia sp.]